jgi:hypothetical protein
MAIIDSKVIVIPNSKCQLTPPLKKWTLKVNLVGTDSNHQNSSTHRPPAKFSETTAAIMM